MAKTNNTNQESRYYPQELAEVAHRFGVMPEVVTVALKNKTSVTIDEAKDLIQRFLKKEVK